MAELAVKIIRFVNEDQPGFVECSLVDAQDKHHFFVEKIPVVTQAYLEATSSYPQPGAIPCRVEAGWQDEQGRSLVRVSTAHPCDIESAEGGSSFVVLLSQVLLYDANQ